MMLWRTLQGRVHSLLNGERLLSVKSLFDVPSFANGELGTPPNLAGRPPRMEVL
jgi:hypothetical protein